VTQLGKLDTIGFISKNFSIIETPEIKYINKIADNITQLQKMSLNCRKCHTYGNVSRV